MAFTIIDATDPVISAKITGEQSKAEVGQLQAVALKAIWRRDKISALFILENFEGWKRESNWGDFARAKGRARRSWGDNRLVWFIGTN